MQCKQKIKDKNFDLRKESLTRYCELIISVKRFDLSVHEYNEDEKN